MRNSDAKGRVAIITGATKGLGKEISFAFATAGYEVIGIYRSDSESAKIVEAEFLSKNLRGHFIRHDITEDGNWEEFDELVEVRRGKRFTLIANASSHFIPKPFHLCEWTDFSSQFEVNVKGTFLIFRRLLPKLVKDHGTFITVLSSVLHIPPKGFAAYLVAKSALEGLTKAAAAEYAERGLRVFSVSPGFMRTPLTDTWSDHLKSIIDSGGEPTQPPQKVAQEILELAEAHRANGEL